MTNVVVRMRIAAVRFIRMRLILLDHGIRQAKFAAASMLPEP
jgi:hypothetical protein